MTKIAVTFELHDGRVVGPLDVHIAVRALSNMERRHKVQRTLVSVDGGMGWCAYHDPDEALCAINAELASYLVPAKPAAEEMKRLIMAPGDSVVVTDCRPKCPLPPVAVQASSRCFRCGHSLIICQCGIVDPNEAMKKRDGVPQPTCAPVPYDWETHEKGRTIQRALRKTFAGLERLTLGGYHP